MATQTDSHRSASAEVIHEGSEESSLRTLRVTCSCGEIFHQQFHVGAELTAYASLEAAWRGHRKGSARRSTFMSEITNEDRAGFADVAVDAYHLRTRHVVGPDINDPEEWEEVMSDLLCDLRHLADVRGLDWNVLLARGVSHYMAEIDEANAPIVAGAGS